MKLFKKTRKDLQIIKNKTSTREFNIALIKTGLRALLVMIIAIVIINPSSKEAAIEVDDEIIIIIDDEIIIIDDDEIIIIDDDEIIEVETFDEWFDQQFSKRDGRHIVMEHLVKTNLNDEKSFEHIGTTFIKGNQEDTEVLIGKLILELGLYRKVAELDSFIIMEFSGKNAFNATVKSTAYAILYYETDSVELLAIE